MILSVKQAQVVPVLKEIAETVSGKTVVSFAAAISTDILRLAAPKAHFVRAMTNIAVRIHKGFTLFYPERDFPAERLPLLERILMELGEIQQVDEQYLDVLTAMSGSGPAYIFTVIESMIYGALREGLPRNLALIAAAHTAIGASCLLLETGKHPAELRDMVLTPGGDHRRHLRTGGKPHTHGIHEGHRRGFRKSADPIRRREDPGHAGYRITLPAGIFQGHAL